ncbi:MAG: tetratricopeptide repeat protein [bacterium]
MKDKIQGYLERLEVEPENSELLDKLKALVAGVDDEEIVRLLDKSAERLIASGEGPTALPVLELVEERCATDDDRADLMYRKGRLLEEDLLDEEAAIACYQKLLELRPNDSGAEERMSHINLVRENWEKIVQKYRDEAEASTDTALTTSLYRSIAEIYQKNNPGCAEVETYLRRSLEVDPTNSKSGFHLERLLKREERWDDLIAFFRRRIEISPDEFSRYDAYMDLGRLYGSQLGDREAMKEQFRAVLELDPSNAIAIRALADAYQEDENWEELIQIYEKSLQVKGPGEPDLGTYIQIGMLWWKKVGDLEQAEPYFSRVRKAQPTGQLALDFYRDYFEDKGEHAKLLGLLQQAQRLTKDGDEKLQLAIEMAEIAEHKADNPEKAIDLWKGIMRQKPGDPDAKAALRRLYQSAEKWNALLEIYKEDHESLGADQVEERIAVMLDMVEIYRDRLNLDVMVINTYNSILAIDDKNSEALTALADKYEAMSRWNDLIGILSRQAENHEDVNQRKALLQRIADLWMDKFTNPNKAIEPLEQILELDPRDGEALTKLKDIYQRRRNWRGLLGLYDRELELLPEDQRRPQLLEMADLAQKRLGDPKAAIQAWNRLLETDAHDLEAIDSLINLYEREKRFLALAEMLQRRLEMSTDAESLPLLERLGILWGERIGSTGRAIEIWNRVLELKPGHTKAMRVLRDLYATAADWVKLETLFAEQGNWPDFIETLHSAADRTDDPAAKVALYFKVADTWAERLDKPERAVKAFERVLAVEPGNLQAARALVPIYEEAQKWPRLLSTYEVLYEQAEEDAERLDLLRKIWNTCEEKLGSKANAFAWCAKAYQVAPEDPELVAELERLAEEADAYDQVLEIYRERVGALQDEAEKVALYRKLAQISQERLGRYEDAKSFFEEILQREPEDHDTLSALERLCEGLENWPRLLEIYAQQVALEFDDAAKLEILFRAGRIQEDIIEDLDAAVAVYVQILDLDSGNRDALRSLEKLHTERADWPALADILVRHLDLTGELEEQVSLEFRLGELSEERLDDKRQAVDYYKRALEHDAEHRASVAALERYLEPEGAFTIEVAGVLAPFYNTTEDWQALARVLEILLAAEEDDHGKLRLMKRLSVIYGRRLGDADGAFQNAQRVFEVAPADEENRQELRNLADMVQDFDSLIDRYKTRLEDADAGADPDLRKALAWEVADIYDTNLSDVGKARGYYEQVLALDEAHDGAFTALHRILQDAGEWAALRTLLGRRVELVADAETKKALLFQICALNEDVLGDVPQAIVAHRAVLELEPGDAKAFAALEKLYELSDQWKDLEELLAQQLGFAEDAERIAELQFRRGQLMATKLDNADGAVDLFTEVLAQDEEHRGATQALEALLDNAALRQRVATILEPLYEHRSEWKKLAANLDIQLEDAPDEHAKVELLARIAELQGANLMDPDAAFTTWRRALAVLPSDPRVRDALDLLIETSQRWDEAAAVWQEGLEATDEGDETLRDEFMLRLAKLYENQLRDAAQATRWYRELLDKDPSNLIMARPAAQALGRLYEAAANWADLIGILRREVEWGDDPELRKTTLYRIAEIQETALEDNGAAVQTFTEIVDFDPEEQTALDNLERLYFQSERWAELIGILKRRVELSMNTEERRALLGRIAMLHEEALEDAAEACVAWLTVLDEQPDDLEAIRALARLYERDSRWNDLYEMLERELDLLDGEDQRVALTFRLGDLLRRKLDDAERALYRYSQVLETDRNHEGARTALEELLGDNLLAMQAAEILEPLYTTESNWEKLCSIFELKADHTADPGEKVRIYQRIAEIKETGMDDSKAAFDFYGFALHEALSEPNLREILNALERLSEQDDRWQDLVALYKEVSSDILDVELQEKVRLKVANISRLHLSDLGTAKDFYKQVLDNDPESGQALDALEEIYFQTEEWEPLLAIYQSRAEILADSVELRRSYLARAAGLCEQYLGRVAEAISCWEQVAELDPGDREASAALERLYSKGDRGADLADLIERRLRYVEELDEAVSLRFQLGTILEKQLEEPDRALENYRATLGGNPTHPEAIEAIERYMDDEDRRGDAAEILEPIYASRHDWARLIETYKIRRSATDDLELRSSVTRKIARLFEEQLEDLDKAFEWYGRLFVEQPGEKKVRDVLTRLAGILEKWAQLAEVYSSYLADVFDESPTSLEVGRQLAQIYDDRLNDVDKAKEYYLRVLAFDRSLTDVFNALESILTRAERWNDLLDVYQDAADAALESEERKSLLFKICTIWEEALGNLDEAISAYRAVLEVGDNDRRAVNSLDRLFVQDQRWADLVELLHRQLEYVELPGEIIPIKLRLGMLYEERMDDVAGAIDSYEEVLRSEGTNPDALAALERLLGNKDERFRVAQILEPIYQQLDDWQKLAVIYDAQLESIEDQVRRVEILREIASIHEHRSGDIRAAFEAMAKAWREDIADKEVLQALEALATKLQDWGRLVTVLKEGIEGSYDYELQASIWLKIARIYEDAEANPAAAMEAYNKLLKVKEDSEEAVNALERLLPALGKFEELVAILRKKADLVGDPLDAKDCYYKIAEIQEATLENVEDAIATLRHLLGIDDADEVAISSLERLYLASEAWTELVEIYQRKIESLIDADERRTVIFQMAYVYEAKLNEAFEAVSSYRSVLDQNPDDMEALVALNRLYTNEKMWPDLQEVMDRQIALTADPNGRNNLNYRAGWVLQNEMDELESAIERYEQVLTDDPTYGDARQALEVLVREEGARESAARVLEPLYRAAGEWEPLIEVLELRLESETDPLMKVDLLKKVAELNEEGRTDSRAAFEAYGRAFVADPSDSEVTAHLERLAQQLSVWNELAALYEKRLEDIYEDELGRRITLTLARVYEEAMADDAKAIQKYNRALDYSGDEAEPLAALDRLLERTSSWKELAKVLEKQVDAAPDPSQQAALLFRLGTLRRHEFGDVEGALQAFRDVLDREQSHEGALAALEQLLDESQVVEQVLDILEPVYEGSENFERVAWLAWKRLELIEDPFERAGLLERIAELSEQRLGDPARAMDAIGHALLQRPDEPRYLEELARLAEQLERWAEGTAVLENILVQEGLDESVFLQVALRCAAWNGDKLGDVRRAEQYYNAALERDPENAEALQRLEGIYRNLGEIEALIGILEKKAEHEYDLDAKKGILAEVADLAENALTDVAAAARAWKAISELDESDTRSQDALIRLYELAGQWDQLIEILDQKARFVLETSAGLALRHRIGELLLNQVQDPRRAADAYRDALDLEPQDDVALNALESIFTQTEEWTSVQDILLRRLAAVDPGPARVPTMVKLARLAEERFTNRDEAGDYWHQILNFDPSYTSAYDQLERLLKKDERWYDLVEIIKRHAEYCETIGDREGEVAQLVRVARMWEERLDSPESATEILETILQRDPNNVSALTGLARLHERNKDWEKCREVLTQAAGLNPTGRDAAELFFRMGRVEDELKHPEDAQANYAKAVEFDPTHEEALTALEVAARSAQDWMEVARLVHIKATNAPDAQAQLGFLCELGTLYSEKLDHPEGGLPFLEQALQIAPDDAQVLKPLADLYYAAGRLDDAEPLYLGLIESTSKARKRSKELAPYHYKLGCVAEARGDAEGAAKQYDTAYRIDTTYTPVVLAIGKLAMAEQDWDKARRIYRAMLLQNIDEAATGISKADVYYSLGLIHEQLNEGKKAVNMFERGLEINPDHAELQAALARVNG